MYTQLNDFITQKISITPISKERKEVLKPLQDYIISHHILGLTSKLNFICTHNSRRSQLSQIWAQTMAAFFQVNNIHCYSGGTETTALFPKLIETIEKHGFFVMKLSENENPVYAIKFGENEPAIIGFSKEYNHSFNPKNKFAALLTCDSADEYCPLVIGADARIPIKYEDPKISDNTAKMDETYYNKSIEIASEMYFIFNRINQKK